MDHHLIVDRVTKTFGHVKANDEVSLHVQKGSIHSVLGENGAGKTTLMNILYGLYRPDAGRLFIDDREVVIESPQKALQLGIGMVHQHFMLVGPLTVAENVILGSKERRLFLSLGDRQRRLKELSDSFGFDVDPGEAIWKLPVGMQQRVEILKLVYRNADILILDEPTSVLTSGEIQSLFQVLRHLKQKHKTILFITHKLEEVMELADYVTVMRGGRVVEERQTATTNARELAQMMVGRDFIFALRRTESKPGRPILEVNSLRARNDRGFDALDGISFTLRRGEILGVAGIDGNGQSELAEVLAGLRPYHAGSIRLEGQELVGTSVADRKHKLRIGYVPEDRNRVGLVLNHSAAFNLVLRNYNRPPFARRGLLDFKTIRTHARHLVEKYNIRLRDIDQDVIYLSGGNQQKLILARELEDNPRLLIVAQPCKGLDVGAIEFVQNLLLEQRSRGIAILYISTELEHIIGVSDRIAVMFRGRITGTLTPTEATPERMGMLMAGVTHTSG